MNSAVKLISVYFLFQGVWCRDFSISLPETVEAVKGLCVLIPCSFNITEQFDVYLQRDPTGIWLKDGTHKDNNRVFNSKTPGQNKIKGKLLGDLSMMNCTTVFYNIRLNYTGSYYFRIETPGPLKYTYESSLVSVQVKDSTIRPSIALYKEDQGKLELQNEVLEGTSPSLVCSAPSPSCLLKPTTFTWNFLPEERRPEQKYNTSFSSSHLNFIATHLHHGLEFTCNATYQLQNQNKSIQRSRTLQVLYAPQVSSSSCTITQDFINCSCEVHGNPAPALGWQLAGLSVTPSEVISIWKETLSNGTFRGLISIQQSANITDMLQCVAFNKLGITSKIFSLRNRTQCPAAKGSGVDMSPMLIGAAVGASVTTLLATVLLCVRKPGNTAPVGRGDTAGLVLNDRTVGRDEDEECLHANKTVASESLHYAAVVFPTGAGSEIRGLSSLTAEYAVIHRDSKRQTKGGTEESDSKEVQLVQKEEEVTYGNITRQPTKKQSRIELRVNDDNKTLRIKETDKEQQRHLEEAEGLNAQVKPDKRKNN